MQTDITVLDQLVVVDLDIHIWSARKKLSPADLNGVTLPPDDLASLGSKRICDPAELCIFGTLKARAVACLERNGVRFLSGWAIAEQNLGKVTAELASIRDEFQRVKDAFLHRYEQSIQGWLARHPQWAGIIAGSVVGEEYVRSRLDFRWKVFKVSAPIADNLPDDLYNEVAALGETLFGEVAKVATETWNRCYEGKMEITRKALSPLKNIHDKLMGLSFIEPRVTPVMDIISTAFHYVPKRGAIKGETLLLLQGLVSMLKNPAQLLEHSQKILDGRMLTEDLLSGMASGNLVPYHDESMLVIPQQAPSGILESHGLW